MSLTIKLGELAATFAARCYECKQLCCLEGCATKHGARMTLENLGWAPHPQRGWMCRNCRLAIKR